MFFKNLFNKLKGKEEAPVKQEIKVSEVIKIFSPCAGELVARKDIPDEGFSEGFMGDGFGIKPNCSRVVSFMTGKLVVLFKTKHAYIIKDEKSGISTMLHLGINTVNIPEDKKAFITERTEGDDLEANSPLCEMNLEVIEKEATSTVSALLVQNEGMEGKKIEFHKNPGDQVTQGDLLMSVVPS